MESVIYYFSATGNSLRIANIMAERMDGLLHPMSRYKGTKCSSRQIGLVFPTYFWGVPRTVAEFVDEMKVEADNPYVFAAATCGGLAGGVLGHLDALLKKKGLHLDYGITIPSVANFIEEYNPKTRSADRKLREADEMAERASAEVIAARRNGPFGFHVWDRIFYKLYTDYKLNRDTGFHVDDTCVRCGICQRICPSRNIVLKNEKPEFQHRCEHCVACINCCPQQAIQWKHATQKRVRYRNPGVSVHDIIEGMGSARDSFISKDRDI